MDVSIVIPTKNGGELFEEVLDMIDKQVTEYTYEVICVDSGSTDKTLDYIKKHKCILKKIAKEDFGHGKTRNLGASLGTGEFIVFITQDAKPASTEWLQNFIDAMKIDPDIAGGFGIHYPYDDCNIFDKRDITALFKGYGEDNTIYQIEDRYRYETEEGYRHLLAFYSDNNSCMRRIFWEKYPYDDVNFAEDQIWAKKIIELGLKKLYCPFAPVYHSHNYPLNTYLRRYYDEYKGLYNVHGYIMVKNIPKLLVGYYRYLKNDLKYVHQLNMGMKEKNKWYKYAIIRDWYRFYASYLAGKYQRVSENKKIKLDKKYSQQLEQIKK